MTLSSYDLAKTESLYAHHRSTHIVGRLLGITPSAVSYRLKKAGVEIDSRPGPKPKVREPKVKVIKPPFVCDLDLEMAAMHQSGKSFREIGEHFNVSYQRVQQRVSRAKAAAAWSPADIQHYPEA